MSQNTIKSAKMFRSDGSCVWCFYLVYFLLLLELSAFTGKAQGAPSSDFTTHRIVKPTFHHGRTKREITTTKETNGNHHPEVTLTVSIDGEQYVLELRLNEDLVPGGHVISYQENGETKLHTPTREDLDICQYSGRVRGRQGSWAAVSTCHGVKGVIYDGQQMRYIQPVQDNDINADHFLYSHEHLAKEFKCGYEGGATLNSSYDPLLFQQRSEEQARRRSRVSRYKRSNHEDIRVRAPYNANKLSRYVELVLVADRGEYLASGEDLRAVQRQLTDVANIINSVYAPLNIFIALVGVVVWTERNAIDLEENGDATLTKFLHYRKTELVRHIPNDNAQLLTRQNFKDGVVGKALKGFICSYDYSAGLASNHSQVLGLVAMTIAHEMGHNFGMEHDTDADCTCPDQKCIMSPSSTSVTPVHWSSCSLKSLALSFERGMDYCLRNKPKSLFNSPTCGNGFLEEGEQCDCGTAPGEFATQDGGNACRACCRPDCTLRANATCGHGQCCDLATCRPKAAGTECRSADRECDLPEYCSGHSQFCPTDVHKMDATPCGDRQEAYCVRGSCRSRGDQCRLLWGTTGDSSDRKCYQSSNPKGDEHGNCGYDRVQQVYRKCSEGDALCGMLQCRHLNERLEFGMESAAVLSATFINNNGTIIPCRTVIIDLGLGDVDPGLVPDGASCGVDRMCMKQRCVSVKSVMAAVAGKEGAVCPSNCSGNGVCNSEGNCHCWDGFAPPLCALPGPGGSYDSGPATDPSVQRNFMVVMYVIFLGIIPTTLLLLFLIYYSRHNVLLWWKKPRKSYVHKILCSGKGAPSNANSNSNSKFMNKFSNFNKDSIQKLRGSFKKSASAENIVKSNLIIDDTPTYANISCVIKSSGAANSDAVKNNVKSGKLVSSNKNNVKEPLRFNRKINKEDIVIAENYPYSPKTTTHNSNLNIVDKKENKLKIEVITNNFDAPKDDKVSKMMLPVTAPKLDVSPKPSEKPKPNTTNTGVASTANEIVIQMSKLRKVNNVNMKK